MDEHALVLGLARSGTAAVLALRGQGYDVVAHDSIPASMRPSSRRREPVSSSAPTISRSSTGSASSSRARGARHGATRRSRPRARDPSDLGDRARSATAWEPDHRHHRHEREDDDSRAPGCDLRSGGCAGRGRGEHRTSVDVARERDRRRGMGRLRAFLVPARGCRHASPAHRRAAQSRARPHRPARHARRLHDAKLRIFENQGPAIWRSSRAASGRFRARRAGSRSRATIHCPPSL